MLHQLKHKTRLTIWGCHAYEGNEHTFGMTFRNIKAERHSLVMSIKTPLMHEIFIFINIFTIQSLKYYLKCFMDTTSFFYNKSLDFFVREYNRVSSAR